MIAPALQTLLGDWMTAISQEDLDERLAKPLTRADGVAIIRAILRDERWSHMATDAAQHADGE